MTISGQLWRRKAVCFVEMPDAPEVWTPPRKPPLAVLVPLEQMCQRCPVRRECARDAVASEAECGMYAGVWVPEHKESNGWSPAMAKLCEVAGLDPGDLGFGVVVGVSA